MNLQDIADFLDMVKNPAKYERVLKSIQDEKDRLNAAIETVGKASELDKLRKEVEVKASVLSAEYAKKAEDLEKSYVKKLKKAETLSADLEAKIALANAELETALKKQASAEQLASSFDGRDKALKEQETLVAKLRAELAISVAEYNEKLAKLRSVMG